MRVRHGRAQHEGMRHSQWDYVVSVAASPGDKAQILMTPHGLTDTEFHAAFSHTRRSSSPDSSYPAIRTGRDLRFRAADGVSNPELGEYSRTWQRNSLIPTETLHILRPR